MTDNARIVRDVIEFREKWFPHPQTEAALTALAALETELATAKADLARAREALRATPCAPHDGLDGFICLRCAALASEQKGE